jgi:glycosyltransferase involved in cell wall biosynthesis
MRIAMFTDYFFPELGGIQDSVATISRALGRRGHQVDIYAPRYAARDYRRVGLPRRERELGANVRVIRRVSLPFPSSTRQSRAALPSVFTPALLASRARPDVIHAHSFFGIGLEALLAAGWLRLPVVGTNHTTIAGFAPYLPVSADRATAYVQWFYNRCNHVTAPSRSVFQELGGLAPPCDVVSNPIDTALFTPLAIADARHWRDAGARTPTITYAGRLGPEKNIDILLHAIAFLRDQGIAVNLALAGHGSHEPTLRGLAQALDIAPRVHFHGTLAQPDLADLLRASSVFAIMSTSETQSMVMLQAMACGVPVVAARTRALPEFVSPDRGVLTDPHDAAELARVFADLLAAPERRRGLGMAGRAFAEGYGVENVTDRWEALYRSMLQGDQGRE